MKINYRMSKVGDTHFERSLNSVKWYQQEIAKCGDKWWLQRRKKRLIEENTRLCLALD